VSVGISCSSSHIV